MSWHNKRFWHKPIRPSWFDSDIDDLWNDYQHLFPSSHNKQYTVKVTKLSKETTEETLCAEFGQHCSPESVEIKPGGQFNRGYVNYCSFPDAQMAVKLYDGMKVDGRRIFVQMHNSSRHSKRPYERPNQTSSSRYGSRSLTNLKSSTVKVIMEPIPLSSYDLERVFQEFDTVQGKPTILKESPNSKLAYVNFWRKRDALEACEMDCKEIKDVFLQVTQCTKREASAARKAVHSDSPQHNHYSLTNIPCDSVVAKLILSQQNHGLHDLVTLKPMKSSNGNGIKVIGNSLQQEETDAIMTDLVASLTAELQEKCFNLECQYIPLFKQHDIAKTFASIEEHFAVEFYVVNNHNKRSIPVRAFATLVSEQLFKESDKTAKMSTLPMYICTLPESQTTEDQWFWEKDDKSFTEYSPKVCAEFNKQFRCNKFGPFSCEIPTEMGTNKYTIDFEDMTQTNESTMRKRSIKQKVCVIQWYYENDHGPPTPFALKDSEEIEKMKNSEEQSLQLTDNTVYSFDFNKMIYTDESTGKERTFCRKVIPIEIYTPSICIRVHGLPEDITKAIETLKKQLEETIVSAEVSLLPPNDESKKMVNNALLKTAQQYFVSAEIVNNKLQLRGARDYLKELQIRIIEEKHTHEMELIYEGRVLSKMDELPKYWEPQTKLVEVFSVSQGCTEWNEVASHVNKCGSRVNGMLFSQPETIRITKIERIQNKWQWEQYTGSRKHMYVNNKGILNEMELFHGTKSTPPEKIYRSKLGFDFRLSSGSNMLGDGTYFAVNASYSSAYAHSNGSTKQMILAKVLTGETFRCSSFEGKTFKRPPVKKTSNMAINQPSSVPGMFTLNLGLMKDSTSTDMGCDEFVDELYDSVSGKSGESDIYAIFDHGRAYPAYLITFNK